MKYFSIPADFKEETIDMLYQLNNTYQTSKVIEVYGQITTGSILNSGRVIDVLPNIDFNRLEQYVRYSATRGINFNYTLNPACLGNKEFSKDGIHELKNLLKEIASIGIKNMTITSPALIELVSEMDLGFDIKASAICEITSPSKALFYKNLGTQRVVIDPDITRDFSRIKNICEVYGDGVEIIINNVCYKNCAYKMFHYNHESHCVPNNTTQHIKDYYFNRCSIQKASGFKNSIRLNWIRPEDLQYYINSGISYFKIQGRQNILKGDIIKTLQAYFSEEYDGNLFDLITIFAPYNAFQPYMNNKKLDGFIKLFYEKPNFCTDVCSKCNYCDTYASKAMNKDEVRDKNDKALQFYWDYDEYRKAIKKDKKIYKSRNDSIKSLDFDTKFDFES